MEKSEVETPVSFDVSKKSRHLRFSFASLRVERRYGDQSVRGAVFRKGTVQFEEKRRTWALSGAHWKRVPRTPRSKI